MVNIIEFFDDTQEEIASFFRKIKYGVQNLFIWFLIIWQDRDWDHWFLYKILQFKLKRMVKLQRDYGHSTCSEDLADQMQVCINLLDRLIKDEYLDNCLKPHEKKWGKSTMVWAPVPDNEDTSKFLRLRTEKAVTPEQIKQEEKERRKIYKHSDLMLKQDLDMLFQNMRKHSEGWWD